jgi:tRNA(Ser,Leu) C12 N-acetylase TAN1
MKIYSEKTNKEYASVEDCLAAEKEYDEAMEAKKAAEEKALVERKAKQEAEIAERKADADEVEAARQELIAAQKKYHETLAKFCQKHGAYHYTIKPGEGLHDLFSSVFDSFWL